MNNNRLDNFLDAIAEIFSGMDPRTFWPLNGGQIDSYFDVLEALDVYHRINELKKSLSAVEIAKIMPPADVIRLFLEHNAIIGLKVADKLKIETVTAEQRMAYLNTLFEILAQKVNGDIFCLDGKNQILSQKETDKIIFESDWQKTESVVEKKEVAYFAVALSNLCYTLYYDIFMAGGFYIHGPYKATKNFGPDAILVMREYYNLQPTELWPDFSFPYKTIQLKLIYKKLDLKLNFANHPTSYESVGDKLLAYDISADGKKLTLKEITRMISVIEEKFMQQSKLINSWGDIQKVKKGAEIAYYLFRNLRRYSGDDWRPPVQVEANIKNFGNKFIEQFRYSKEPPSSEHWKKLFDPRNNYF